MGKVLSKVKRYRSSRGFGIHSPFAYGFVVNTLRCTLPYYSYEEIERMVPGSGYHLRLLLRVLCALKPSKVYVEGAFSTQAARVVTIALGEGALSSKEEADFLFTDSVNDLETHQRVLTGGGTVMIDHGKGCQEDVMPFYEHGMTFTNGGVSIIVGRPDLPRQLYKINF